MERKINILHLTDMAGGSSFQSHFYEKFLKGKSLVLIHKKNKRVTAVNFYNEAKEFKKFYSLIFEAIKISKKFDLIHVHQAEIIIPILKIFTRKKIILSYQGSDINELGRSKNPIRIVCRSMADIILYNQKLHKNKIITIRNIPKYFIANGIDTDFFSQKIDKKIGGLTIISSNLDKQKTLDEIKKIEKREEIKVKIIDTDFGIIPFEKMPELLNQFEYYFDIKITDYGLFGRELSNTGLQALACGCKVIHDYGKGYEILEKMPEEHKTEYVINKLFRFYKECFKN